MKKLLLTLLFMTALAQAAEIKVAAVSFDPQPHQLDNNITGIINSATIAAQKGAKLIVFPEHASSGFAYVSLSDVSSSLDTIPGKLTNALAKITMKYHTYVVVGIQEKDPVTDTVYNSAALVGPNGYIGKYRKNQLNSANNVWETPGNLGFPVFDTEIGKIGLIICYDDSQLQSMILPNLRGADILAYPTGAGVLPKADLGSNENHSTIVNMATIPGWLGMNVVAADITGVESIPQYNIVVPFMGASSIWDNRGNTLNSAPASTWTKPTTPTITYATIDVGKPNPQKEFWLKHRRPELYKVYNYHRSPIDHNADLKPSQVSALLVQYKPQTGDIEANYNKIEKLITNQTQVFNLVVLPYNSFIGNVDITKNNVAKYAENLHGNSYTMAANLAKKYRTYLLFSMPEIDNGKYYETAIMFDSNGKQVGIYRKAHLNDIEQTWASAGNDLPIFKTEMGRIAVMLNDETRIPELTEVYELQRANLILIPVAYNQKDYGGDVNIPKGLVPDDSNRGMYVWYNIAKYSQAYTLVANYINGAHHDIGQSALYSLVPEEGYYPPRIALNTETAYLVNFTTNTNNTYWTNQQDKVAERRYDQALPLTLDMQSKCFQEWLNNSSSREICNSNLLGSH